MHNMPLKERGYNLKILIFCQRCETLHFGKWIQIQNAILDNVYISRQVKQESESIINLIKLFKK